MADSLSIDVKALFPETSLTSLDAGRFMALIADKIHATISDAAHDFGLKEGELNIELKVSPTVVVQEDFQSICKRYLENKTLLCSYGELADPAGS